MKNIYPISFPFLRSAVAGIAAGLMSVAAYAQKPVADASGTVDRIVAVVNHEAITQRALDAFAAQIARRLQQQGATAPDAEALRAQALEQMVLKQVMLHKAREEKISVSEAERAAALDRLVQESGLPREEYRAKLERQGIFWSTMKREMEDELLLAKLRVKEIESQIVVPDAEVRDYLDRAVLPDIEHTHARHILLRADDSALAASARQQLLEVKKKVEAGADFARFARQLSIDGTAAQGGDLGWLEPGQTVPEFERAMASLKAGEISAPVRSPYGVHLIQVLERRRAAPSAQQRQNIARQAIGMRKAAQAHDRWLRALRDQAYVRYMVPVSF
ncbi:putative Peptidylprolyl isomerase [Candidatus Glomeribacter gigasporarum BEG34]|uniref:Putative Peptidylprolyl isomerase n=1 Tax=Candidatus Glomeribacter gigasporarum BEG34 TaxID=1070319 RepID=G2J9T2_9BURK|nr:peptidylprolyl isomerase [Candidatus Glomeribacter gigasporarum]CCD29529.1 putative Peptidylprolyl isomerase [Candidatus Glomeribacter gigasporarum BEG34]